MERLAGAEIALTNKVVLDATLLENLSPTLRYVGVLATGYNVVDVEAAMEALGEITGQTMREEITNRIFERFCVGK